MNKPKLYCDFDGVIADTVSSITRLYNRYYINHPNFKPAIAENCTKWNMTDICPLIIDIEEIFYDRNLFYELKPFPDAIEIIRQLQNKYQIIIATIGHKQNLKLKIDWIDKYLPFIDDFIGIVNQGLKMDKSILRMDGTSDNQNVYIDDNCSNLFSQDESRNLIRYCYGAKRTEWNAKWLDMNGRWLKDWNDAYKELMLKDNDH